MNELSKNLVSGRIKVAFRSPQSAFIWLFCVCFFFLSTFRRLYHTCCVCVLVLTNRSFTWSCVCFPSHWRYLIIQLSFKFYFSDSCSVFIQFYSTYWFIPVSTTKYLASIENLFECKRKSRYDLGKTLSSLIPDSVVW